MVILREIQIRRNHLMLDNQLIQLFLPIIKNGLVADGFGEVLTQQKDQPTQQGIPRGPTVYFQKLHDHRYGWVGANPQWNGSLEHNTEIQWHETTFQISTLVVQNPLTPNQYTAADLANEVASIMQSEATQAILMAQNVGLLRVTEITNPYFQDDRDQFEATPSFDLVLTHLETRVSTVPVVSSYDAIVYHE